MHRHVRKCKKTWIFKEILSIAMKHYKLQGKCWKGKKYKKMSENDWKCKKMQENARKWKKMQENERKWKKMQFYREHQMEIVLVVNV